MAVVHRQRRHPVAAPDAEPFERLRQPPRILREAAPVAARLAAVGPARDDLAVAMFARGVIEQGRYPEFEILHAAEHRFVLSCRARGSSRVGPEHTADGMRSNPGRCYEDLRNAYRLRAAGAGPLHGVAAVRLFPTPSVTAR